MIRAIAIDDEPLALRVLEDHAFKISFLHIERSFTDPLEGLEYIRNIPVTAVFLDIKMHNISGVELAEIMPAGTHIIFTTAYPDYAVKGFELDAVDYLLKPVSFSRFLKACHKLKNNSSEKQTGEMLLLRDGSEVIRIRSTDIFFIEATGNYLKLHTAKGVLLHRQTMKEFIEQLPADDFIRTHKSYIVNLQHISRIESYQLTIDNQKIPLSANYKTEVWDKLGIKTK